MGRDIVSAHSAQREAGAAAAELIAQLAGEQPVAISHEEEEHIRQQQGAAQRRQRLRCRLRIAAMGQPAGQQKEQRHVKTVDQYRELPRDAFGMTQDHQRDRHPLGRVDADVALCCCGHARAR